MWLRNFDNMQLIILKGNVETELTSFFGNNSLCLKKTSGYITPGDYRYIISKEYCGLANHFLGLRKSKFWSKATNLTDFCQQSASMSSEIGIGIIFGSSTEKVTYDDYTITPFTREKIDKTTQESTLEEIKLSYVDNIRGSFNYDTSTGKYSQIIGKTVANNNEEPITINEMGIICAYGSTTGNKWGDWNTSNTSDGGVFLIYREVLENPVILTKGESHTFTIKIEYITHNPDLIK